MKRSFAGAAALSAIVLILSGCGTIETKSTDLSVIYGITAAISFLLLVGYCCFVRKRDIWFLLLLTSIFIVNAGYLSLALSTALEEALLANRIAYFGSVLLPTAMLIIIFNATHIHCKKWVSCILICISLAVFFIAASPGYLDIYYKEVSFSIVNGVAVLDKVYGPLHSLYAVYLISYFIMMIAAIIYSSVKKNIRSAAYAAILAVSVLVNLCVWLLEQFVKLDFELLSVSYIISEMFLFSIYIMNDHHEKFFLSLNHNEDSPEAPVTEVPLAAEEPSNVTRQESELHEARERFIADLNTLTRTESAIVELYIAGKSTQEILAALNIKENTLKYHNKNIYSKLGVLSRKQLIETARKLELTGTVK